MPPSIKLANIPITEQQPKVNLLAKLAANPQLSWRRFVQGLVAFVIGGILIFAGAYWWIWLQIPSAILLILGALCAIRGYIGMLASRFYLGFSQLKPPADPAKQNEPPG